MSKEKKEIKKEEVLEEDFLLDISDESMVYTIEAFDNQKRDEDKQMKVYIKPLSGKDLANIASNIRMEIKNYRLENPDDDREFMDLYSLFSERHEFVGRIEKLENFKFKIGDEIKEFTDPNDLYTFANSKIVFIVNELRMKFMQLDMLNSKNS